MLTIVTICSKIHEIVLRGQARNVLSRYDFPFLSNRKVRGKADGVARDLQNFPRCIANFNEKFMIQ